MFEMTLSPRLCQSLRQRLAIVADDDLTSSVFPAVEQWLAESTDNLRALRQVAHRAPRTLAYRSLVDLLLCEVCPEYRRPCGTFYHDQGEPLRKLATPRAIARAERKILAFLAVARERHLAGERASWAEAAGAADVIAMMEAA